MRGIAGLVSNGGMIQYLNREGVWVDAFATSYKPNNAVLSLASKINRPCRLVNRKGTVIFTTE